MMWKPSPRPEWKRKFPLFVPIVLDDGLRILWEWVFYKSTITREWGGMGAGGCEGYTEYRDALGTALGRQTWRS